MSSKKKGFLQAVKERHRSGPQGGRQPKMDFKGKPMEYWESRYSIGLRKQKDNGQKPIIQLAVMPKGCGLQKGGHKRK